MIGAASLFYAGGEATGARRLTFTFRDHKRSSTQPAQPRWRNCCVSNHLPPPAAEVAARRAADRRRFHNS